ncbi:hypothetical protein ACF1G0_20660 [Streptomyces sp. NPDC013953]|uniref:hypothetical protein n=1 Tax=Streptomyces sp. NPDC013953 TaxID=3364868 RepID=UPI0036FFFC45
MAAGRSAVALAPAERLPRAAHVRGDAFRRMIVPGRAELLPEPGDEALAQLLPRHRPAAAADPRAADGFTGLARI